MRDHSRALREIRSKSAGMIEMMMRIDDIFDLLIRDQPVNFLDDGQRPGFVLWRFHHRDKILEFNQHAVVSASA